MKTKKCTIFANAKINLHLQVLGKRFDGYHNISSVMQSVSLCDKIELELSEEPGIRIITKNEAIKGNNLAVAAAEKFLSQTGYDFGVNITLEKQIPVSAGLGGGSADAAAVLVALNHMTGGLLSYEKLCEAALCLGADVPFCIKGGTQRADGLGEVLTPVNGFDEYYVILIKNHKKQSTGYMYSLIDCDIKQNNVTKNVLAALEGKDLSVLKKICSNDFLSVSPDKKEQQNICSMLYENGAFLSGLSGSGPTVFAVFENEPNELFVKHLKSEYKEVYVCRTAKEGLSVRFN